MNFLRNQMKAKVNIGARIYAMLLIVYNGMALLSYYNIMKNPDILRKVAGDMSLPMTEEQIQSVIAEIPLQLALVGIVIFGLTMLILNQRWGFVPFAAIPTANAVMAVIGGDLMGGLSAMLPVVLMTLILFVGPGRLRRQPTQLGAQPGAQPVGRPEE